MLTLWIIGSIVWVLVLLFSFAIFSVTKMAEESAREVGERDASVKAA